MKKIFTLLTFVITMTTIAQSVSINVDGSRAHSSAIFEVKSTTKGVLIPRLTKFQRNAISNPATGLQIWCRNCSPLGIGEIQNYNGSVWTAVTPSSTADIAASIDKNYVTDAQVTVLENTLGANSGDNATNSQYSELSTDVSENTAKVGVTELQANEIVENTAKVGYTESLVSANETVVANTNKVGITESQATDIRVNTEKVGITSEQASEIVKNNDKEGYTEALVSENTDVVANTAKTTNATHTGDVTGSDDLTIGDKKVLAKHLNSLTAPADGDVLTYVGSTEDIQWSPFKFASVTEKERDALTPVEGMMVYNKTTNKPNYYNGTSWMNYDGTSAESSNR
jgi:hypothetical protein